MTRRANKFITALAGIALLAQSIAPVVALAEVTMRCGGPGATRTCGRANTVDAPSSIAATAGKMHCCCTPAGTLQKCRSSAMSTEASSPRLRFSTPTFAAGSNCTITVRSVGDRVRLYALPVPTPHALAFDVVLSVSPINLTPTPSSEVPHQGTYAPIVLLRDVIRSHGLRAPPLS